MGFIEDKKELISSKREKYKNAFFYGMNYGNMKEREKRGKSESIPEFSWKENGHTYTAEFSLTLSRANTYPRFYYTRDGKKTTWTAIKASLKRLKQ